MKRMTKVLLVVALALGLSTTAFGFSVLSVENHMDFDREIFTTTFTGFATDASGSWFFFLDLDTGADYSFGYAGNYFEVSRDFDVGKLIGADGLSLHFEYNGSTHWKPAALLAGAKMALPVPFLLTASLSAVMYRNWDGSPEPGATWQATLVWSIDLLKDGDQSQIVFTGLSMCPNDRNEQRKNRFVTNHNFCSTGAWLTSLSKILAQDRSRDQQACLG